LFVGCERGFPLLGDFEFWIFDFYFYLCGLRVLCGEKGS